MTAAYFGHPVVLAAVLLVAGAAAFRGVWSPCGLSMISAINPFSERSRGHRYPMTALWFGIGSVAGGALLGAIGAAGAMVVSALAFGSSTVALCALVCCLITLAADSRSFGVRLPLIPRQVNERWIGGYRRWVYASGFGAQIGVGLATYVMTAAVYLTPVLGALSGSAGFALCAGLVFGLVRGLAVLMSSRAHGPEPLLALHRRLAALEPWSLRVTMVVQAGAALLFGWAADGLPGLIVVGALLATAAFARLARSKPARLISSDGSDVSRPTPAQVR